MRSFKINLRLVLSIGIISFCVKVIIVEGKKNKICTYRVQLST